MFKIKNDMKATELRIGNYISDYHASDTYFAPVQKLDYQVCFYGKGTQALFHSAYSDLKPIPLTEQWLLGLGFKVKRGFYEKGKLSILLANLKDYHPNGRVYYNSWAIMESQPKYVHQLQNLYFALMQEELILKERSKE